MSPFSTFILLLSFFILTSAHANTPTSLAHISDSNTLIQDQQGYIWIAGIHGLTRFDGNKNLHFSKNSHDWPIPYTWINNIALHDNKFLVATENQGIWTFDPLNGQSTKFPIESDNSIYNILHHKNNYYFHSYYPHRLYKYSLKNKKKQVITKDLNISSLLSTENKLYFSTLNSLYVINNDVPQKVADMAISSTATILKTLFVSTDNKIWAYEDSGKKTSITLPEKIRVLTADHRKNYLFAIMDSGAIYKFDSSDLSPLEHAFNPITSNKINDAYLGRDGVLWINNNNGIQRFTENRYKNNSYNYSQNKLKMSYLYTTALNNSLLVGTSGRGIYDFNGIKNLLPENINDSFSSAGLKIMDLLSHNQNVFIATFDGLWKFNLLSQELKKIDIFPENTILLSLKIKKNKLYIGTDNQGLVIYNLDSQTIIKKLDKQSGLSASEVIDILPLNSNTLWIATAKGIDTYNSLSNKISQVEKLGRSKVYSLTYANNKIFAATQSDGVLVYNHQGILLSQFGQYIAFHSIENIDGELWASSANGLYKINPKTHQISLISNTETYKFTDTPIKLNNKIYVPHYKGILELPLETESSFNAKVYISKTSISGKAYLQNTSIKLESSNEIVLLELASLDYRLGQAKQYQYQINSGQWNQVNGDQLTLASLAPGTYRIKIKGTNSLGEWSENYAFTEIQVAFPWYWSPQIRLAYIVIILFISFLICWLLFLRFKSIKNVHDLLSEDIVMRGKTSLHVSKNISQVMTILEDKKKPSDNLFNLNHNKAEICSILQECLDELSSLSKTQEPDALYGKNLSVALPYFVEFVHKKYHVALNIKYEIDEELLCYEIQSDIYKIIYEAITAAILKGSNGNFSVSIQEFKDKIWLMLNDDADSFVNYNNKINFDVSMYFIRQIAKKHNASINTFHDKSKGSQLLISFPLMIIT